jgi:Flp pilus assembly pilin Flp
MYVKAQEWQAKARAWHKARSKGQTMTEYALILAAIAIVVYATYKTMGQDITSLVTAIDSDLTSGV